MSLPQPEILPRPDHPHAAPGETTPEPAAPFPWQHVSSLAGLPPLDPPLPPERAPASMRLPAPYHTGHAAPRHADTVEHAPATGAPAIDRARIARLDRRAFAVVIACVLLLLLGAGAPFALALYATNPNVTPQAQLSTPMSMPTTPSAPTLVPTAQPTQPPAPTQVPVVAPAPTTAPTPKPTATPQPAATQTPTPISSGALTAPSRLTLACRTSAGLPIQNTSNATIAWSAMPPAGVLVNGWSAHVQGTLAPRGRLVLAITERPDTSAGTAPLVFTSQGQTMTVTLALASC